MNLKSLKNNSLLLQCILMGFSEKKSRVGGQAIIEGVMMRSKQKISWAVRRPDGETVVERFPFVSLANRYKILSLPVIRGCINLYESLKVGYNALTRSAQIAAGEAVPEPPKRRKSKDKYAFLASFLVALAVSLGIFMYLPMLISQVFLKNSAIEFNILAGAIRITLFILYLVLISLWKDIRRVFEYHGAEHKAIFTFEDGKELTLENMRPYSTHHPRCGTSFLLLVALICIFLFSVIDSLVTVLIAPYPNVMMRFFVHIALVPVVAGLSYEVLRLSDRFQQIPLVRFLILPGLWLQNITTKEPDDSQLQVAASALRASL
ncbi:MAG TPA: DUF1385 domain-containing protein [Chitinivibrionales bacterium]|nr:DUF1385 domain-containing protein [Chitinivibrionales bacterium]